LIQKKLSSYGKWCESGDLINTVDSNCQKHDKYYGKIGNFAYSHDREMVEDSKNNRGLDVLEKTPRH